MHPSHADLDALVQEQLFIVAFVITIAKFVTHTPYYSFKVAKSYCINTKFRMPKPRVIYWFRTDLRLHDSPALKAALDLKPECLYPIWTWDPHYVYRARVGPNRWQYLLDCQNDLSKSITKLNPKSKLFVVREAPQTLFPKLFKAWKITHLVFEKDTDAYARDRDEQVMKIAKEAGIEIVVKVGRTLYDPDQLVKENHGKPTMSISQVQAAGKKIGSIPRPIPAPKSLPNPGPMDLNFDQEKPAQQPDINAIQRESTEASYSALAGPNGDFAVPTMQELGLKEATTQHRGGETIALKTLDEIIANETYTATFEKPKTAPTAFEPQSTTLLSPHMHFGSLSVREFYWRCEDVVQSFKGHASQPPTSLTGQLLFRDMYFGAQAGLGYSFGQTYNNPSCRFIPWHLPSKIDPASGLITGEYLIDSQTAEQHFQRWRHGRTGFPWIDALMRQLKTEGWIHHLGRHAVACFLTRGGCYIDWERGAEVFEEWLIDHEAACNIGNGSRVPLSSRSFIGVTRPLRFRRNGIKRETSFDAMSLSSQISIKSTYMSRGKRPLRIKRNGRVGLWIVQMAK
jgi:deoxyribodipyrimidine photolyase